VVEFELLVYATAEVLAHLEFEVEAVQPERDIDFYVSVRSFRHFAVRFLNPIAATYFLVPLPASRLKPLQFFAHFLRVSRQVEKSISDQCF